MAGHKRKTGAHVGSWIRWKRGKNDDIVVMRTYRDEDVLCRFKGMQAGYIITETVDGETENRYRVNSIADCKVVEHIEFRKGEEE